MKTNGAIVATNTPTFPLGQTEFSDPLVSRQVVTDSRVLSANVENVSPQYISVGPEYFGLDSDIAPFVISRAGEPSPLPGPFATFEQTVVTQTLTRGGASQAPQHSPLPRRPDIPDRPEIGEVVRFVRQDLPPLHEPQVSRVHERRTQSILTVPIVSPQRPLPNAPIQVVQTAVHNPSGSLSSLPSREPSRQFLTQRSFSFSSPQKGGAETRNEPQWIAQSQPSQSGGPRPCYVERGAANGMVLVCRGSHLGKAKALKAVIEGESAMRGLRSFDSFAEIVKDFGFNGKLMNALVKGPSDLEEATFVQVLNDARRRVRVKGHTFHIYLVKGSRGHAMILVES